MRVLAIVIVSLLSNACAPSMAVSTVGGAGTDRTHGCGIVDVCSGGTGEADGVVSLAVGSAIVGTLAYVLARHLRSPTGSRAASRVAAPAPASSLP